MPAFSVRGFLFGSSNSFLASKISNVSKVLPIFEIIEVTYVLEGGIFRSFTSIFSNLNTQAPGLSSTFSNNYASRNQE